MTGPKISPTKWAEALILQLPPSAAVLDLRDTGAARAGGRRSGRLTEDEARKKR